MSEEFLSNTAVMVFMLSFVAFAVATLGIVYPFRPFKTRKRAAKTTGAVFAVILASGITVGVLSEPTDENTGHIPTASAQPDIGVSGNAEPAAQASHAPPSLALENLPPPPDYVIRDYGVCLDIRSAARSMMYARQVHSPIDRTMHAVLHAMDHGTYRERRIAVWEYLFLQKAYSERVAWTQRGKDRAVADFAEMLYTECSDTYYAEREAP